MKSAKWVLGAAVFGAALAALPAAASADACECVGGAYPPWGAPPPVYAVAPQPYAAPIVVIPYVAEARRHWGLGLRATGMSVVDARTMNDSGEEPLGMGGGGLFLRYRSSGHLGFELAIDGAVTEDRDSEMLGYQRATAIASGSLLYRFSPRARFDWHLLAGIGAANTEIRYGATQDIEPTSVENVTQTEGHVGIGFEYKFGWRRAWVLSADLRFMGLHRNDAEDAHIQAGDKVDTAIVRPAGQVPDDESGASANIGIAYYF